MESQEQGRRGQNRKVRLVPRSATSICHCELCQAIERDSAVTLVDELNLLDEPDAATQRFRRPVRRRITTNLPNFSCMSQ